MIHISRILHPSLWQHLLYSGLVSSPAIEHTVLAKGCKSTSISGPLFSSSIFHAIPLSRSFKRPKSAVLTPGLWFCFLLCFLLLVLVPLEVAPEAVLCDGRRKHSHLIHVAIFSLQREEMPAGNLVIITLSFIALRKSSFPWCF